MKNKLTLIVFMMLLLRATSFGLNSMATLLPVSPPPGQEFSVDLNVKDFVNVSAMTLYIQFNPNVLTPKFNISGGLEISGVTAGFTPSDFTANVQGGNKIVIAFSDPTRWISIADGRLLQLNFVSYCGPASTPLQFVAGCDIEQNGPPTPVTVTFVNGTISPAVTSAMATIGTITGNLSNPVSVVPVTFSGFSANSGSMDLKIQFDPSKVVFQSLAGTGGLGTGTAYNANNGVLSISWSGVPGVDLNTVQYNLTFIYLGPGSVPLTFVPCCLIGNTTGTAYFPFNITNGNIQAPAIVEGNAFLESLTNVSQGEDVLIPLYFTGFQSGSPNGTGAFTLNIPFDSPRLTYLGYEQSPANPDMQINLVGSRVMIAWSNNLAPAINGSAATPFLKLKFKYNGVGIAHVGFGAGCSFANLAAQNLNVIYTDATITPKTTGVPTLTIGTQTGFFNQPVSVPITFTDMPGNIGAATMFISFDGPMLSFINGTGFPAGTNVNVVNNVVRIAWSSTSTLTSTLFGNLNFVFMGGGGSISVAPLRFVEGNQLASVTDGSIITANWVDGAVIGNSSYTISGKLEYNSDPLTRKPMAGYTVSLMSGTATVTSAITNASGNYSFLSFNGNYTLKVTVPSGKDWYADNDDVITLFAYTMGTPIPLQNALRLTAGDVVINGAIDIDDVVAVFLRTMGSKPGNYTAADFIFENKAIVVLNSDLLNQNFMGLCSGDVLGKNSNP